MEAMTFNALMQAKHPCLLTSLSQFFHLAKGKRVTVFMDYDGTTRHSTAQCTICCAACSSLAPVCETRPR